MRTILYLENDEEQALRLFAEGRESQTIYEMVKVPYIGIWPFMASIRRKTGIRELSYPKECGDYIRKYEAAMLNPQPLSANQRFALGLLLEKNTYDGIAYRVQITTDQLEELFKDADKRMGIFTQDETTKRLQYKLYLATFHSPALKEMSFKQENCLRHWANGKDYGEIADLLQISRELARILVKEGCVKLGLNTRGRGTQRKLLFSFLEFQDAMRQAMREKLMDDPMF